MRYIELLYAWAVVLTSSKQKLLHIGQLMNIWQWPFKYFGKYYLSMPNYSKSASMDKYRWHRNLFDYVSNRNTEFDKLRYHNVVYKKNMTESYFFTWFYTDHQLPMSEQAFNLLKSLRDSEIK